ncbi:MAG TPA: hypothetical protein VFZ66_02930 [Herpetosiphonaceae bacterium]
MLITVDLSHPENDVEVIGLAEGETLEARLGPRGYAAYRIFGASARLLFLALQDVRKADIAAATEMMLDRESSFIRQRLDELRRLGAGGSEQRSGGSSQPPRRDPRPPDQGNGHGRRRK